MKRRIWFVFAALMVLLIATAAYAQFFGRETDINYYQDDAFLTWTGEYDVDCAGNVYQAGVTFDSWRVYDQYSCRTGDRVVHRCQQTDGVGGWITLACPANQP